jgi:hypothetical protein
MRPGSSCRQRLPCASWPRAARRCT